jgi:nicotinamidase-related amidase
MGPSTGGAIVGTMSSAADLDYETIILEDCCIDTDLELHNVLIRQLFPRRATVMTAQEFLQKIGVA